MLTLKLFVPHHENLTQMLPFLALPHAGHGCATARQNLARASRNCFCYCKIKRRIQLRMTGNLARARKMVVSRVTRRVSMHTTAKTTTMSTTVAINARLLTELQISLPILTPVSRVIAGTIILVDLTMEIVLVIMRMTSKAHAQNTVWMTSRQIIPGQTVS